MVGAGRIGTLRANMAMRHPSVEFLAISDVDEGRATALANNVKADFASGDNLSVIAHPSVDAVFVSTPEHAHTERSCRRSSWASPCSSRSPLR